MDFINGFFLVNFVPFALLTLLGLILFFLRRDKPTKYYYPLLFIIIVLAVISLWRIPVINDRRYAMPTLVPGIIISVFMIMLLPDIIKKYLSAEYTNAIVRTAVVILLAVCIAKTMREQEHKPYLQEIPEALQKDCDKNNVKKAVALVLGNPGGHLVFGDAVKVIGIPNQPPNNRFTNVKYQFTLLNGDMDPEILKMQYPHLYLLCIEQNHDNFRAAWEKKYLNAPELIFEYVYKSQIAYRLYRVKSTHKTAWMNQEELEHILKSGKNLIKNSDFKNAYRFPPDNSAAKILRSRGISINNGGEAYLPDGWLINPSDGWSWNANCSPVSINLNNVRENNTLTVKSNNWVTLYTSGTIEGNKIYLMAIETSSTGNGQLMLQAYTYTEAGNHIRPVYLRNITLDNRIHRHLIPFQLENCGKIRLAFHFYGIVTIDNIKVVSLETNTASDNIR